MPLLKMIAMAIHLRILLTLACLFAAAGCGSGSAGGGRPIPAEVLTALEQGDSFELFSLDPLAPDVLNTPADTENGEPPPEQTESNRIDQRPHFHGWIVLGGTKIDDKTKRQAVLSALTKGVAENEGVAAACFIPRHGLRAKLNGKTYDVVICFHCLSGQTYVDDERGSGFLTTGSPQPALDQALQDAGIQLPEAESE
jgi:hypothetical protein